jgi:hypothetical protein
MKASRFLQALPLASLLLTVPARADQGTIVGPTVGPKTMIEVMTVLNAAMLAIQSCNSGTSAPVNGPGAAAKAYQCWADTSAAPAVSYKTYDGASWVTFGQLNTSTHLWTPYRSGAPIAAVATSSSAADLTTGTLPAARLPAPTVSTLGGVQSLTCSTSNWMRTISTAGAPGCSQPAFSDLTGSVAAAQMPAFTGDVTTIAGGVATTIGANKVQDTMLRQSLALSLIGRSANSGGNAADITATAGSSCAFRESGSTIGCGQLPTAAFANAAVTNAKLAPMANGSTKCRTTAGSGDPEDCTAAQMRALLSLVVGTDVQAFNANLAALAGLTTAADKLSYWTGAGAAGLIDFPSWARSVVSAANVGAGRAVLGLAIGSDVQAYTANLAAVSGLTGAAGKVPYFTGLAALALFDSTTFGRSVSNVADAAALRALAAAVIGTNVQAWDADLDAVAANTTSGFWARTGAGIGAARTATGTANEVCVTNGDGVSGNPTFGICAGWLATARTYSATQTFAGLNSTGVRDNQGTLKLSSFVTSTQLTANQNDYTATDGSNTCSGKTSLRISTNASRNITGLSCGQAEGDIRIIHNVGAFAAVLTNQDAGSSAANRFLFGSDMTLAADTSVTIRYDGVASRWRAITTPGAGGGGGGAMTIAAGAGMSAAGTCNGSTGTCTVASVTVYGQALLAKVSSNIVLSPKGGNLVTVNGVPCTVPDAGVSLAPTGLTAGSLYFVYATCSAGAVNALEASTTGHSISTTAGNKGVEIKTGDDARTLVGMIRPASGPAFVDSIQQRFVRSWFNDSGTEAQGGFTTDRTTTSTAPVELNSEIRTEVLLWSGERLSYTMSGSATLTVSGGNALYAAVGFDSATVVDYLQLVSPAANFYANIFGVTRLKTGQSEGYHWITLLGAGSAGTATYKASTSSDAGFSLNIMTRRN